MIILSLSLFLFGLEFIHPNELFLPVTILFASAAILAECDTNFPCVNNYGRLSFIPGTD